MTSIQRPKSAVTAASEQAEPLPAEPEDNSTDASDSDKSPVEQLKLF